jgi:hypothetical protein
MDIVEGWTEPLDFELWYDTSNKLNGVGMLPTAEATDKNGVKLTLPGTTTWVDAANGRVRYSPSGVEFTAVSSPYGFRIKVQAAGKNAWWPNASPLPLVVRK